MFNQVYETLPGTGWLTKEEAEVLFYAAQQTVGPILEVGSYHGRSTVLLASLGRPVYSVDPFSNFDSDDPSGDKTCVAFLENLRSRGITNVTSFKVRVEEWEGRQVGFAYLDGDHTEEGTFSQIEKALQLGARRMCLHDYCNDGEGRNIVKVVKRSPLQLLQHEGRMAYCSVLPSFYQFPGMNKIIVDSELDFLKWRLGGDHTVEIFDIQVGSERGEGRGRKMVNQLVRDVPPDTQLMYAITRTSNLIAREFYEHLGFRVIGMLVDFYDFQNGQVDAMMYGRKP